MLGAIYYTDNCLGEPYFSVCQGFIQASGLPITSCSLKPIGFGENIVVNGPRSYPTMVKQIATALEHSKADYVFFCEHDVLYHTSHWEFLPLRDDVFYYNSNVWRWWTRYDYAVRWDRMLPLSCMCANREFALEHYRMRLVKIEEWGLDAFRSREPRLGRIWGYEPGTKKRRRGGFSDDEFATWRSEYPNIDIRHKGTFSSPKVDLRDFTHAPTGWQECSVDDVPGWRLREMFGCLV